MDRFVCSCGILFGDNDRAFEEVCKKRGHLLLVVTLEVYRLIFDLKEENNLLKDRIRKRNKSITFFKDRIEHLQNELRLLRQ